MQNGLASSVAHIGERFASAFNIPLTPPDAKIGVLLKRRSALLKKLALGLPRLTEYRAVANKKLTFDKIGYWSEIKIEIIEKYAKAYSTVITGQKGLRLKHFYIDGFAGAGEHVRKSDAATVVGSPMAALSVTPPFNQYYFIELEPTKVGNLQSLVGSRSDVKIMQGDCNRILLEEVFPQVRYEHYRRALCILDPYGLHLKLGRHCEGWRAENHRNLPELSRCRYQPKSALA